MSQKYLEKSNLDEYLESLPTTWPNYYLPYLERCQEHPNYKEASEIAYLLSQLNLGVTSQIASMLHYLQISLNPSDIVQEEQSESLIKSEKKSKKVEARHLKKQTEAEQADEKLLDLKHLITQLDLLNSLNLLIDIKEYKQETSQEILRKMILAMAKDIRVMVIILARQVIIMRYLKNRSQEEQLFYAKETITIYAPLANRLGLARIKWELEDLSLRYIHPQSYKKIAQILDEKRIDREIYITNIVDEIKSLLIKNKIEGHVSGRVKHLYSIWRKMEKKGRSFEELFDVRAVRIIAHDLTSCYTLLGMIHEKWTPIPKEFDDYIANPKINGYQSLHTAVIGPQGKTLEVQIRTATMHQYAEFGVAAHWIYKEGTKAVDQQNNLNWLRNIIETSNEHQATSQGYEQQQDIIDHFKSTLFDDKVYAITPKGKAIELMAGATALDFAYLIHTDLGHRCRGAKVNGKIVPLTYVLKNSDVVEVLAAKEAMPSRDWLSPHLGYLKSNRARSKVRAWFKQQDHDKNLSEGKSLLDREISRLHYHCSSDSLLKITHQFGLSAVSELYVALGSGDITLNQVIERLMAYDRAQENKNQSNESIINLLNQRFNQPKNKSKNKPDGNHANNINVKGVGNLLISIASCCKPAPPELIGGFITLNKGVSIHLAECPNFLNMLKNDPMRQIEVQWGEDFEFITSVDILLMAYDRADLLKDVIFTISDEKIKINSFNMLPENNEEIGKMSFQFSIGINHIDQLSRILDRLEKIPNVIKATRK